MSWHDHDPDRHLRSLLHAAVAELDQEHAKERRERERSLVCAHGTAAATGAARIECANAQRFLRELDPDSQEGMWFDALAERYPSRLDAAIAYLHEVLKR